MTRPFESFDELRALLDALCEESISPEQQLRLEEMILHHPEAEAYYVQYMSLQADLAGHFSVLPGLTEQDLRDRAGAAAPAAGKLLPGPAPAGRNFRRLLGRAAVGLSGLAAGLLLALALRPPTAPHHATGNEGEERVDDTVAVLLQAPEAEWGDTELPTRPGAPLPPGWLRLKSGYA